MSTDETSLGETAVDEMPGEAKALLTDAPMRAAVEALGDAETRFEGYGLEFGVVTSTETGRCRSATAMRLTRPIW
ncbi:hypothetical protein [Halobacterium zhouii]|uniref:hypothetical protein n=1 Tax=Halobacterium zhouii TaxID=2902624 RepID=UPI001E2DD097|nr:hypothetical protein [Halobacterium zhouii]